MNTPALIQVRQRHTPHGAGSRPVIDTVGCNITEEIGTPRCRLSPRTYSQQYEEWREAYDERQREPTQSESADFGEGDSTGVQSLD
jgi:hypothetical protein